MKTYTLRFKHQTESAFLFNDGTDDLWVPKSKIEIDSVSTDEYPDLREGEELDVLIPDWLAIDKGLL